MGLLNGGGAAILSAVFRPLYLPGTLTTVALTYPEYGDPIPTEATAPIRIQIDSMTESMRGQEGAADQDRRALIFSDMDFDTDAIVSADAGEYAGTAWLVMSIGRDPCASYWDCRVRRKPS